MKLGKRFWGRMFPVIVIVIITAILSVVMYQKMVEVERETCWQRLEIATKSTAEKIQVRVNDNLNFLDAVSNSVMLTRGLEDSAEVAAYLNSIVERTIFERITVIFPDNRMLLQSGEILQMDGDLSFDELVAKGLHVSPRYTDWLMDTEVMYCFTPIIVDGEAKALLSGTINCETISEIFEVFTYRGQSQLYMVDCADGNYLMDNWHETLGNIYELGERVSLDGKTTVDLATPIINRETGRVSYVSQTNGQNSYQYHAPVPGFNWQVVVVVQEDVVFRNLLELQRYLKIVGVVETILVLLYLVWNILVSSSAVKSEDKAKQLEMEKAGNEAKAKFMSNMSHDVRTPINGIVGMLYIIKKHRDDEQLVDECLKKIEVSTQYLSTLASDMLDVNEIESDKLVLESNPIDLRKLGEELSVMVEPRARESEVEYRMDCSKLKNPYVLGSAVHIKRILMNLINNAIKYSKESGGEVCLTIEEVDSDPKQAVYAFVVQDNGIGMSEEFQKNMYGAFEQEKITARSDYQGYGLGLTIVSHLVKKLGGMIELESEKGKGSTFTVMIPLQLDTEPEVRVDDDASESNIEGMRILLVEDNEFNMEIAETILTDAGAVTTPARNGRIATELFAEAAVDSFDIILMDIMMPEMDGVEATKVIRAMNRPDAKNVPIIAMTANAFVEEIKRCKDAGMNEHIAKPLDIEKLIVRLGKYAKK